MRFALSTSEAPLRWLPAGAEVPDAGPWRDRLGLLDDLAPNTRVHLWGCDPLALPDLHVLLDALDARGLRAALHTDLPGLHDDQPLRRFAPHDVCFVVRFPTHDPVRYAALTGQPLDRLEHALRNVRAFGYPVELSVPVVAETLPGLDDTVVHVLSRHAVTGLTLAVGGGPTGEGTSAVPSAEAVGDLLRALDAREIKPRPRLRVQGMPPMALPLEAITRLHLVVDAEGPDDDVPELAPEVAEARRAWLDCDPRLRPGFRGDPRDHLVELTGAALLRPGHEVYALVAPLSQVADPIVRGARHGLTLQGRFADATLAERLDALVALLRAHVGTQTPDLAMLRDLAHALRRGLKPQNDGEPVRLRAEGA